MSSLRNYQSKSNLADALQAAIHSLDIRYFRTRDLFTSPPPLRAAFSVKSLAYWRSQCDNSSAGLSWSYRISSGLPSQYSSAFELPYDLRLYRQVITQGNLRDNRYFFAKVWRQRYHNNKNMIFAAVYDSAAFEYAGEYETGAYTVFFDDNGGYEAMAGFIW